MEKLLLLTVLLFTYFSLNAHGSTQLALGYGHTCILHNNKVSCWGLNDKGQTTVPQLKNPRMVTAGGWYSWHTCALDDEGVKCWGNNSQGQTTVPQLKNPRMVTANGLHTCALDDEGVKCWGYNEYGQRKVPQLENPKIVVAGRWHTCALDDEGVKCWGNNSQGQTTVPQLENPRMVTAGVYHTCALDDEGVKCWGDNEYGQTNVPPEFTDLFPTELEQIDKYLYKDKAQFFRKVQLYAQESAGNNRSQLLLYYLVEPVVNELTAERVQPFKNSFKVTLERLKKNAGINSFAEFELTKQDINQMLKLSKDALMSVKVHLSGSNLDASEKAITIYSRMIAKGNVFTFSELIAFIESIEKFDSLFATISLNRRTRGRGLMLSMVLEKLRSQ